MIFNDKIKWEVWANFEKIRYKTVLEELEGIRRKDRKNRPR